MLHKLRVDLLTLHLSCVCCETSEEQAFHLSGSVAYDILSRDMADRVPPDAMADLSRATRVTSSLSLATRGLSRDMADTVPVPDATDPTDLSRASRVASNLSLANRGLSRGMTNAVPELGGAARRERG